MLKGAGGDHFSPVSIEKPQLISLCVYSIKTIAGAREPIPLLLPSKTIEIKGDAVAVMGLLEKDFNGSGLFIQLKFCYTFRRVFFCRVDRKISYLKKSGLNWEKTSTAKYETDDEEDAGGDTARGPKWSRVTKQKVSTEDVTA